MKIFYRTVLLMILLIISASFADKSEYYDNKADELEELNYQMEDEQYDSAVAGVEIALMDSKTSFGAMEELNAIRIMALFKMGQYEETNYYFKRYFIAFPESKHLVKLVKLDIQAYERRRHYLEAVISSDDAIRMLDKNSDSELIQKVLDHAKDWVDDNLNKEDLLKAFGIVNKPIKTYVIDKMNREGIPLPVNESVIVKEMWNDRVKKGSKLRGTLLGGFAFPELKSDTMLVPITAGMMVGGDIYYRLINGIAVGGYFAYQRWNFKSTEQVLVNGANGEEQPEGIRSQAVPFMFIARVYSPQFWRLKISLEGGVGGIYYARNEEFSDGSVSPSGKIDLALHVGDMVELRGNYTAVADFGDQIAIKSNMFSILAGFAIRRYH